MNATLKNEYLGAIPKGAFPGFLFYPFFLETQAAIRGVEEAATSPRPAIYEQARTILVSLAAITYPPVCYIRIEGLVCQLNSSWLVVESLATR